MGVEEDEAMLNTIEPHDDVEDAVAPPVGKQAASARGGDRGVEDRSNAITEITIVAASWMVLTMTTIVAMVRRLAVWRQKAPDMEDLALEEELFGCGEEDFSFEDSDDEEDFGFEDGDDDDDECLELNMVHVAKNEVRKIEQGILVDSGAGVTIADGSRYFADYALETGINRTFVGPGKEVIKNRGQRQPRLRLGREDGPIGKIKFQDAPVRRPILSVGDSTSIGNLVIMDEQESAILLKGCPEIEQIRKLVKKAISKIPMRKHNNVFQVDAWVVPKNTR